MDHSSVNQIILDILTVFMALGALDKITQGKLRLGLAESFDEGISAMGPLAVSGIGMLVLAPALTKPALKLLSPIYGLFGADPAMFAGTFLSSDIGGYPMAAAMTQDADVAAFSGLILGGILGVVISFTMPIALGILGEEDRAPFARGVLYGLLPVPLGALAGGLAAGFSLRMMVVNLLPILVLVVLMAIGIRRMPERMISGFGVFGKLVTMVITLGLACAIIESLTGIALIPGMAPISDGFQLVGSLAIVLAGAYPLLNVVTRVFGRQLKAVGARAGINEYSVAGAIACLANAIPMFGMMKRMDERGKVVNSAFAVSGAFVLGDHLAYTASVSQEMMLPVILAKLVSGVLSVLLALYLTRERKAPAA